VWAYEANGYGSLMDVMMLGRRKESLQKLGPREDVLHRRSGFSYIKKFQKEYGVLRNFDIEIVSQQLS